MEEHRQEGLWAEVGNRRQKDQQQQEEEKEKEEEEGKSLAVRADPEF